MNTIEIQTLVDITQTNVNRPKQGSQKELDQQRNFTTLKQCLEIRSNIMFDIGPQTELKDIKGLGFGSEYKGKHQVWIFRFNPERNGAYVENGDEIGCLYTDIDQVPIVKSLAETINIDKAIFDLKNPLSKNTVVRVLKGTF
jgi:hypothetical protein